MRRGDYLLPQHSFCELTQDYFLRAITNSFLPAVDYNFLVFSNDIEYSKTIISGDNVWFVTPKGVDAQSFTSSEKEDLALLSLCDNHIITNSSYSWWGAYLSKNPNKKVICPTCWLNPRFNVAEWINGKYFPSSWINIDNI